MKRVLASLQLAAGFAVLCASALAMLLAAILTGFRARRFYAEVIGRWVGELILRMWGIRYRVFGRDTVPDGQVVYISNHPSAIEIFLLTALALPRTRFFHGGWVRKQYPPIGVMGTIIRNFWTVDQKFPAKRREIFQRADRILRETGDSVYLSPEGMRVATGEIGHFNKGAFHLATSLGAPLVPIYFAIPDQTNPGMGYDAKPGTVDVYFLPAIATTGWRLDKVEHNRDAMKELFVRVHTAVKNTGRMPANLDIERQAVHLKAIA